MKGIKDQASEAYKFNGQSMNRNWTIVDGPIYDLTLYIISGRYNSAKQHQHRFPKDTYSERMSQNDDQPSVKK